MEYAIFVIILAVLNGSHSLNPEILKYDQYMKDFETTGRRIKQDANHEQKMDGLVMKRESPTENSEDDKYVAKYGNDHFSSGVWTIYRKVHEDEPRMRNLCAQAHKIANKPPGAINTTAPAIRKLMFHDLKKYHPIRFDVLIYTVLNQTNADQMPLNYYLTKGLTQDCVYYAKPTSEDEEQLMLDQYVCGLKI